MPVTIDINLDHRYRQGLEKGKLQGKLEGKLEVATDMLKKGMSIDLIKEVTGLSEKDIFGLRKS